MKNDLHTVYKAFSTFIDTQLVVNDKKKKKIIKKQSFFGQVEEYGAQRETIISVYKFLFQCWILFATLMLLLVHRNV